MSAEFLEFYKGKRVFVTGHTGFKGSWLCSVLLAAGARVFGYSLLPPTDPNMFDTLELKERLTTAIGDVRDFGQLCGAMRQAQPDVVFHLAAQPIVRLSYKEPVDTFSTNVMGTVHLLEAVRLTGSVKSCVIITTDKVYENLEQQKGYTETDRLGGSDPYAASKACCEIVVQSYRSSFFDSTGAGIATARAGNVIGGGDYAADRIIPDCIRYIHRNQPIQLRNPHSVRPWQHVLEPLCGYLMLAQRIASDPKLCTAFNFGPEQDQMVSTGELASLFCDAWGGGATWVDMSRKGEPHETNCLRLDNARAKTRLCWEPKLTTQEAIRMTVEWEKAADKKAQTNKQIETYFNL